MMSLEELAGGSAVARDPAGALLPEKLAVLEIRERGELGVEGDDAQGVRRVGGNEACEHAADQLDELGRHPRSRRLRRPRPPTPQQTKAFAMPSEERFRASRAA